MNRTRWHVACIASHRGKEVGSGESRKNLRGVRNKEKGEFTKEKSCEQRSVSCAYEFVRHIRYGEFRLRTGHASNGQRTPTGHSTAGNEATGSDASYAGPPGHYPPPDAARRGSPG